MLALQEKAKIEADKQAVALQEQMAEPVKMTAAKLDVAEETMVEIKETVMEIEAVEEAVEIPVAVKDDK